MVTKKKIQQASVRITADISINLFDDIIELIDDAKKHVAYEYNSTQALLCWLIGKRIDEEILKTERAEYGESIVTSLAKRLTLIYGKGYSRPNLFRMIKFASNFLIEKLSQRCRDNYHGPTLSLFVPLMIT